MHLYSYFRSSASYRVRIALALKGLDAQIIPVNLLKGGQFSKDYLQINPHGRVPSLEAGGHLLTQSLAIIEYLEETQPQPPLLPSDPLARARVRMLSQLIACDISPLNNRSVLVYLEQTLGLDEIARKSWIGHWISKGFEAFEALLRQEDNLFCHGDAPGMADCCLVPQVYNAERFAIDLTPYPAIRRIANHCEGLFAFQAAHPSNQPDAA